MNSPLTIAIAGGLFLVLLLVLLLTVLFIKKRPDKRLGYYAHYDTLTGLINRPFFQDRLTNALARARRDGGLVTVMFIDIDGFKDVNDRFGHAIGDEVLRQVASRLVASLRESDTVARLGGDEFTVILEGGKRVEDAGYVAMKVIKALGMPYEVGDREIIVTASIGIAVYPVDGDTYEELMKGADTAMYQSKAAGRNTFQYYTRSLRNRTAVKLALVNDLREAVESGTQLRIEYQPKVDLSKGTVIGLEALLRWDHPERGLLLPGDFVALAEESDLIMAMTQWLIDDACHDMNRWLRAGLRPMRVAVNISDRLFRHANLVESIAVGLAAANLDPRFLEIEVTERTITQEPERTERVLDRIADMGVRVSIDGFGTGYSSLRQLQRLSVHSLKIDRSFVSNADTKAESRSIIESTIAIATSFGLDVVAVGVESPEELGALRALGCSKVQGHLIARPLRPENVIEFVESYDQTLAFKQNERM